MEDGASVVVSDVDAAAVERVRAAHPEVEGVDVELLPTSDLDVYAPCALGGSLTDDVVGQLKAAVVCGAANNQLAHPGVEALLAERGILYAPDYVANGGGLIQVGDEALHAADRRLPLRAGEGARHDDLRHRAGGVPQRGGRRGAPRRRRGPARRAPDGGRRTPAPLPPAGLSRPEVSLRG